MTMSSEIKIGTKVRTAAVLTACVDGWPFHAVVLARRRPGVLGEVYGFTGDHAAPFMVRHEDGSGAPYLRDELTPIPDEKTAPTTPIGRLRATICDVTGASLYVDQWEKIDVALREVEEQIEALHVARAEAASDGWEVKGPITGALARLYPNPDIWHELEAEDRSRVWSALRWLVNEVKGGAWEGAVGPMPVAPLAMTAERRRALEGALDQDATWARADSWEVLKEVDRLRAIEAIRVADVEAVLQRHAVAAGAVGPMPVEKAAEPVTLCEGCEQPAPDGHRCASEPVQAADPWPKVLERIEAVHDLLTDLAKPDPWLPVKVTTPEPVKPARPRVGGWVETGRMACAYDDRGVQVAYVWKVVSEWHWWAARPFLGNIYGTGTEEAAKGAAVAVLATWADVEGAEVKSEADRYARKHGAGPVCSACTDALGSPSPCAITHDFRPGAYEEGTAAYADGKASAFMRCLRATLAAPLRPGMVEEANAGAEIMRDTIFNAIQHEAGGLPMSADECAEDPPIRCGTFDPEAVRAARVARARRARHATPGMVKCSHGVLLSVPCGDCDPVGAALSLVVAFGSEGSPVILEATGPWEGIEDRPSPPARGLWRWVGKAMREPDEQVGGHDFEGSWTALPVPA
jgi:hypothetical protein